MAGVLGFFMLVPSVVPAESGWALTFDAALPWLGVPVGLILIAALARRRWLGVLAALAAAAIWCTAFVPTLMPLDDSSGAVAQAAGVTPVTVFSQNVQGATADPGLAAQAAVDRSPDLVALQELDYDSRAAVGEVLDPAYSYNAAVGTVGLWSRFPIEGVEPLELGLGWNRAFRATLNHPDGEIVVYVVHAASVRLNSHASRDAMLAHLADTVANDPAGRIIAVGDFNAGSHDRSLAPLQELLDEPRQTGGGFGFTWPSGAPLVRLDHVLVRGFKASENTTLKLGGSDHRANLATLWPAS